MKMIKNIVFVITTLLIPIGFIFRLFDIPGGSFFMALGFFGFFVYYTIKTIKNFKSEIPRTIFLLQIMIVLMSFSLFTRYLYHIFGDYPSLIIVPLFIFTSLIYLIKEKAKVAKLTTVSLLYILLTIPLFGLDFHKSPRHYIPKSLYDRYGDTQGVTVTLPYSFRYSETEQLSIKAFDLRNKRQYFEAILIYKQARNIEPENPRLLFDLSETYARINDLETAITLLDTAIMIDNKYAGFYNNRGLLYYKLKENDKAILDYQKAIELDSTQFTFYSNLALVYYHEDLFDISCQQLEKAESLGLNINDYKELKRIKKRHCE